MLVQQRTIPLLSVGDQVALLENVSRNPRHRLMVLLMLDCGLRVSETTSLRIGNFDFQERVLNVASLKKKTPYPVFRNIPLSPRVVEALSEVYIKLKDKTEGAFLFPTNSKTGHISRIRVWRMIKKYSNYTTSPHVLRHTFATSIVKEGADIRIAQDLLGHASYKTTEIYVHAAKHEKRHAINKIDRRSKLKRLKDKVFPKQNVFIINHSAHFNDIHIGRKEELKQLNDLFHKRVNTILLGPQGIGKSQIISMLHHEKVLRLDDFKSVKTTIGDILLSLYNGEKDKIINLLTSEAEINKTITKNSVSNLIKLIEKSVEKNEYTLLIDDLSNITPAGVTALEKLKNTFHIIAAARQVKYAHASFLTNFQKIEVAPLSRLESTKLIMKLSKPMLSRIEDIEAFKNHIYDQTSGNPLFIREIIERFSKEPIISIDHINDIRHSTARRDFDMSIPVVVALSSLMVLRYIGGELGDDNGAFRLFGGAFMLFALFARSILRGGKRKFV